MSEQSILIVDDSAAGRQLFQLVCESFDCQLDIASDGEAALALFAEKKHTFVLTDYRLLNISGIEVVRGVRTISPDVPCLIFTAFPDEEVRQFTEQTKDCDYLIKPVDIQALVHTLKEALQRDICSESDAELESQMAHCPILAGNSPAVRALRAAVHTLHNNEAPLLLENGDSWVGKSLAHFMHMHSPRTIHPFIDHTCACNENTAAWEDIIDSEGSRGKLIRNALSGTLLLSDLQCLHQDIQQKMARHFEMLFHNIRLITTVNYPQTTKVHQRPIYLQLYSKISATQISLPPLSERTEDTVPILRAITQAPHTYGIQQALPADEIERFIVKVQDEEPLDSYHACIQRLAEHTDKMSQST